MKKSNLDIRDLRGDMDGYIVYMDTERVFTTDTEHKAFERQSFSTDFECYADALDYFYTNEFRTDAIINMMEDKWDTSHDFTSQIKLLGYTVTPDKDYIEQILAVYTAEYYKED